MGTHNGVYCEEDEEEVNDSPYCECGSLHGMEEIDFNQCDYCGKIIYIESVSVPNEPSKPNDQ
jgi:methionyl-tRNA synthetase